jgi:hypothetical protein
MHPVARVSTNICRNLLPKQMSVLVLLCTSYTTCTVRTEATDPLTYTVTALEFFVLQTT